MMTRKAKRMKNNNQFSPDMNKTEIPQSAAVFTMGRSVTFKKSDDDQKQNLKLNLYDGGVHNHPYWGTLAFSLEGMKLARKRVPILFAHDTNIRLGMSSAASFDGGFELEGSYMESLSPDAAAVKNDMDGGFEFESSLAFDLASAKLEWIDDGQSAEVNGKKLKGPGTVVRNCKVIEGSVCVFGALNNTRTRTFENDNNSFLERNRNMTEKMTIESFKADHSDLHAEVFNKGKADGEKAERDLFARIVEACGDDKAMAVQCFTDGKTPEEALQMRNDKLAKDNAELTVKLSKASTEKTAPEKKVDPAKTEFSDDAGNQPEKLSADNQTEKQLRESFANDVKLQEEFGDDKEGEDSYVAFVKNQKAGNAKIFGEKQG